MKKFQFNKKKISIWLWILVSLSSILVIMVIFQFNYVIDSSYIYLFVSLIIAYSVRQTVKEASIACSQITIGDDNKITIEYQNLMKDRSVLSIKDIQIDFESELIFLKKKSTRKTICKLDKTYLTKQEDWTILKTKLKELK